MAAVSNTDSKRMHSWWWNSHISPKSSKWLQENLTDMDAKVKQMIKLIEEDADSFARRAEMYYKKRPELKKLVEEFYRAYRALADRYDNATGVLRQAHQTMAEAFPNQVPPMLADDSPAISSAPHQTCTPVNAYFDGDDSERDALKLASHFHAVKRNVSFTKESDLATNRKGLKQLGDLLGPGESVLHTKLPGQARNGLIFHGEREKETNVRNNVNHDIKVQVLFKPEQVVEAKREVFSSKKALAKLESEKEAVLLKYQESMERLSNLEEESQGLIKQASKAEAEIQTLNESLAKSEAEKEASLLQCQQYLDNISNLENRISTSQKDANELHRRAIKAETEVESLRQNIARLQVEKEAIVVDYKECLDIISNMKHRLQCTEEDFQSTKGRADETEHEVVVLKQEIAKQTEEKDGAALHYQMQLEKISKLEMQISSYQEEVQRLNHMIDETAERLKKESERCLLLEESTQAMHSKLELLVQKMESQSEELAEKQKEFGGLWNSVQEERMQFMEAETAFQTLQHLQSQSQEDLKSLAAEIHNKDKLLQDMETCNQALEGEIQKVSEENEFLNELKLSSGLSIKNLQDDIINLRLTTRKLEDEVELRAEQRNALQQEIYCLKEELNSLNEKHNSMLEQVESVGFDPECFGSSVMKLQDENSKLKETCETKKRENVALLENLEIMEKLLRRNAALESTLSDLNVELEGVRGKVKILEASCPSSPGEKSTLVTERSTLISQLHSVTKTLDQFSEKNNLLETLCDVNAEHEGLRLNVKNSEDSCFLLDDEKSSLISERETIVSQLDLTQNTFEISKKNLSELELKHLVLETERSSAIRSVEELRDSLNGEWEHHSKFVHLGESQLSEKESQILLLKGDKQQRKSEYEKELDKSVNAQIEVFILQKVLQDLEEKIFSLSCESQMILEAFKRSEKTISKFEAINLQQRIEVENLSLNNKILRMGLFQVLKTFDVDAVPAYDNMIQQDQILLSKINYKLKEKCALLQTFCDENQELINQKSVLLTFLRQHKQEMENQVVERDALDEKFRIQSEQLTTLQAKADNISEKNEELRLRIIERDQRVDFLTAEIESQGKQLSDLQRTNRNLWQENCKMLGEKRSLSEAVLNLCEEKNSLEEEMKLMFGQMISQTNNSIIYENIAAEKFMMLKNLSEDNDRSSAINDELEKKLRLMAGELEEVQMENSSLKHALQKSKTELESIQAFNDQLHCELTDRKEAMSLEEEEQLEAKMMLNALKNEKTVLPEMVKDLKSKYGEAKMILEGQEKQILKMSLEKDLQSEEFGCLHEVNKKMKSEIGNLRVQLDETKRRENNLRHALQEGRNENEPWETQAAIFFGELQICMVSETLLEGRIRELNDACQGLELKSISRGMEIEQLKEKISSLGCENGRLKDWLAAYVPTVSSLKDSVNLLEEQTLANQESNDIDEKESKEDNLVTHLHGQSRQGTAEDQLLLEPDELSELQYVHRKIAVIEEAVTEMKRRAELTHSQKTTKQEDGMTEIEELKSERTVCEESIRTRKIAPLREKERELQNVPVDEKKIQENEVLMEDIMLDQMSECSSRRRGTFEADDQMLQLWDTTNDKNSIVNLNIGKTQKPAAGATDFCHELAIKECRSEHATADLLVVKELSVDRWEISKRFTEHCEESNKRNVLERLNSDAQKLKNLQITVEELKKKVELTEKSRAGKVIGNNNVKMQLRDAEDSITKLFDENHQLMKNTEAGSLSFDGRPAIDESGSITQTSFSEMARKGSERVERLQLEVQRIQFLLMKLEFDEKLSRGKTKITERIPRVPLQDYLHGGMKTHQKRKKTPFCSCIRPPTKGQ